ncbi:MAG: hypothetical protein WCS28_02365 [Thiomicrospira sp.]|jgi:predicted neutral ceramidase superfamily lipid hydrolase
MATVINTHNLFNALKASGFDEKQANEVLNTVEAMQNARLEEVATKADMQKVNADLVTLDTKIDRLQSSVDSDAKITRFSLLLIFAVLVLPYLKGLFV